MPAKSRKQYRMMAMVAHDPAAAKRLGIPQSVGAEFVEKTPKKKRSAYAKARARLGGER